MTVINPYLKTKKNPAKSGVPGAQYADGSTKVTKPKAPQSAFQPAPGQTPRKVSAPFAKYRPNVTPSRPQIVTTTMRSHVASSTMHTNQQLSPKTHQKASLITPTKHLQTNNAIKSPSGSKAQKAKPTKKASLKAHLKREIAMLKRQKAERALAKKRKEVALIQEQKRKEREALVLKQMQEKKLREEGKLKLREKKIKEQKEKLQRSLESRKLEPAQRVEKKVIVVAASSSNDLTHASTHGHPKPTVALGNLAPKAMMNDDASFVKPAAMPIQQQQQVTDISIKSVPLATTQALVVPSTSLPSQQQQQIVPVPKTSAVAPMVHNASLTPVPSQIKTNISPSFLPGQPFSYPYPNHFPPHRIVSNMPNTYSQQQYNKAFTHPRILSQPYSYVTQRATAYGSQYLHPAYQFNTYGANTSTTNTQVRVPVPRPRQPKRVSPQDMILHEPLVHPSPFAKKYSMLPFKIVIRKKPGESFGINLRYVQKGAYVEVADPKEIPGIIRSVADDPVNPGHPSIVSPAVNGVTPNTPNQNDSKPDGNIRSTNQVENVTNHKYIVQKGDHADNADPKQRASMIRSIADIAEKPPGHPFIASPAVGVKIPHQNECHQDDGKIQSTNQVDNIPSDKHEAQQGGHADNADPKQSLMDSQSGADIAEKPGYPSIANPAVDVKMPNRNDCRQEDGKIQSTNQVDIVSNDKHGAQQRGHVDVADPKQSAMERQIGADIAVKPDYPSIANPTVEIKMTDQNDCRQEDGTIQSAIQVDNVKNVEQGASIAFVEPNEGTGEVANHNSTSANVAHRVNLVTKHKKIQKLDPGMPAAPLDLKHGVEMINSTPLDKSVGDTSAPNKKQKKKRLQKFGAMSVITAEVQNKRVITGIAKDRLLQSGDIILGIDGIDISNLLFHDATKLFAKNSEDTVNRDNTNLQDTSASTTNEQVVNDSVVIECILTVARERKVTKILDKLMALENLQAPTAVMVGTNKSIAAAPPATPTDVPKIAILTSITGETAPTPVLTKIPLLLGPKATSIISGDFTDEELQALVFGMKEESGKFDETTFSNIIANPSFRKFFSRRTQNDLKLKWDFETRCFDRTLTMNASKAWREEWEAEENAEGNGQEAMQFISPSQRSLLKNRPRPYSRCKCGSLEHQFVSDSRCVLYRNLRILAKPSVLEDLNKMGGLTFNLEKYNGKLNSIGNAQVQRLVKRNEKEMAEQAEAKFVDAMEQIQTKDLGIAVFAPRILSVMILSSIATMFPNVEEPLDDDSNASTTCKRDEGDGDDNVLLMALSRKRKGYADVISKSSSKKLRGETPAPNAYCMAKLLVHISKTWGHLYQSQTKSEYAW